MIGADIGLQMNGAAAGIVLFNAGAPPTIGRPRGGTTDVAAGARTAASTDALTTGPPKDGTTVATAGARAGGTADSSMTGTPKDVITGVADGARIDGATETPMTRPPNEGKTGAAAGVRIEGAVAAVTTGPPKDRTIATAGGRATGVCSVLPFTACPSLEVGANAVLTLAATGEPIDLATRVGAAVMLVRKDGFVDTVRDVAVTPIVGSRDGDNGTKSLSVTARES